MLITEDHLVKNGIDLKAWVNAMQRDSRGAEGRSFTLAGPCVFPVRPRRTGTAKSTELSHSFMGGERFRIGSVVVELCSVGRSWTIKVVMTPLDMTTAGLIASASMLLEDAIHYFDGMEDWVFEMSKATAPEPARVKKPATIQEQRAAANPAWGAWGA